MTSPFCGCGDAVLGNVLFLENVLRGVFDMMSLQEGDELRLEWRLPMVLLLVLDVGANDIELRLTYRKRSVAGLPLETTAHQLAVVDPL